MLNWFGLSKPQKETKTPTHILSEDFLKALYEQSRESKQTISLESIREQANIPQDKLAEVVGILAISEDIVVSPLGLTPSGEQRALSLVRAHRMYEKYLAEHSGYAPEEWHSKADEMEHNLGKQDKERIMALLRNPLWDPHGDPIPTERYQMPESHRTIAAEVEAGTWYKVLHIEDDDKKSFRQISSIGLASDTTIQICALEGERIKLFLDGQYYYLPKTALRSITLAALDDDDDDVLRARTVLPLTALKVGQMATIVALSPACVGAMRRRLMDLGFVRGSQVSIDMCSPMGNPTAYVVRQTAIALREDQARFILVEGIQAVPE